MSGLDFVNHDRKFCALEIRWKGTWLSLEERNRVLAAVKQLAEWRRPERHHHSEGVTHLYPIVPAGVIGEYNITNWYNNLCRQAGLIIDEINLSKLKPEQIVQWDGKSGYIIALPKVIRNDEVATRQLITSFRARRGKVSVVINKKDGTIKVLTHKDGEDELLMKGLHDATVHKAKMCTRHLVAVS